ncbi:hypothetical protein C8R45DRAFT_953695 [Mycena sanguinolenta]|nr:hypothetical protein C8R45DRAFT_953695 [Mycena sanguinolenta]
MSFQHFRLSETVVPLQQHLHTTPVASTSSVQQFQAVNPNSTFPTNHIPVGPAPSTKAPYGSGDTDDGYTLVFPDLQTFHEWRLKEEEDKCVEFVKGDTHGSKAVPPRFKDHTKLVCARHSRSGRKKYVKKHPERVRKVPSRKLEGDGCGASISFKTYYDTEEVRACYVSQHSHEIGLANFPFTRRGRKAAAEEDKHKTRTKQVKTTHPSSTGSANQNAVAATTAQNKEQFSNAISMLAPLPAPYPPPGQPAGSYFPPPGPAAAPGEIDPASLSHDRWENMATLFESVRGHARAGFEYPGASVAALETVLIRLYLESPLPRTNVTSHDPNIQPNLGESNSPNGHRSSGDDG